ncbi:MAG: alpha/beta hydrolase [Chloroflexaceae bacterium]|nr:alpha/beta hydrolase [Chloroflexaceae bacterium]
MPIVFSPAPVSAAERIFFNYRFLDFSISVSDLETFAKTGEISRQLNFYLRRVTPEQREQFRRVLQEKHVLNPVQISRFLNTPMGEDLLTGTGRLITFENRRNGKLGLRSALVKAASEPGGVSLLSVLQRFPTNIRLNTSGIKTAAALVTQAIDTTNAMTVEIQRLSAQEITTEAPVDFAQLADLRLPGRYITQKRTLNLTDPQRDRQLSVDLYYPQTWRQDGTPVVVMSHGLASNPQHFQNLARHLSSHGFLVAVPQHPASDSLRLQAFLNSLARDVFDVKEFIDRPLDITFVIDELERRNRDEFANRLKLDSVGVIGHSFGGYAVLAVAGATIDWEHLQADCDRVPRELNLSLLLQCRALALPRQDYQFRDERVKVVVATNPVNGSIFGPRGLAKIQIPVVLAAGTQDPATPVIFEQLRAFVWLKTPEKYLALVEGQAHINTATLDARATALLETLPDLLLPEQGLIDNYGNSLGLAFFEVFVAGREEYRPFLKSGYARFLSEKPFGIYLVNRTSSDELTEIYNHLN